MFAQLLVEMLTGKEGFTEFDMLDIDAELKCIIYECMHASEKTEKRETTRKIFNCRLRQRDRPLRAKRN